MVHFAEYIAMNIVLMARVKGIRIGELEQASGVSVHCFECPLRKCKGRNELMCKAIAHYNRHTKVWEYDEEEGEKE